jgi:hypothetical protein
MEESGMSSKQISMVRKGLRLVISIFTLGVSMNATAGLFGLGDTNWKEEVLLHDGTKIVVERSHAYGGSREIGQPPSIKEQGIAFSLSGTGQTITWKDEYGKEVGGSNFILLALHVLNGAPYIVVKPNLCRSYNKWGRPNPPYVVFKYDGKAWQRIPFTELPTEFKATNLSLMYTKADERYISGQSPVPAEHVRKSNARIPNPESTSILREPVKPGTSASLVNCEEMIPNKSGKGVGIGFFMGHPTYEACLKACSVMKVSLENCPCNRIFGRK